MGKKIDAIIVMVKFAFIFCLLMTFYYGVNILVGYYEEHKDLKFTEEYEFKSYDNTIPQEIQVKVDRLNLFRRATLITLLFFFLLEFLKYKREPETHWVTELEKKFKKKDEIQDNDRKE